MEVIFLKIKDSPFSGNVALYPKLWRLNALALESCLSLNHFLKSDRLRFMPFFQNSNMSSTNPGLRYAATHTCTHIFLALPYTAVAVNRN